MIVRFPEATKLSSVKIKHGSTREIEISSKRSRLEEKDISTFPHTLKTPKYDTFQYLVAVPKPSMATPQSVAIDEERGHIYMADCYNKKIRIFSEKGDSIREIRGENFICPYGVLVNGNRVYVTDWGLHVITMFLIPDHKVMVIGGQGSGKEQFNHPLNLALSPDKLIYVADSKNNRLQILNCDLNFQGSLQHNSLTNPVDVKFNLSYIFVLSCKDNPCLKIFTLTGELVRSIITRGEGIHQAELPCFFCLDASNNIIISDFLADDIKIFSPKGKLVHTIDGSGILLGSLHRPQGIAIMKGTKLVTACQSSSGCLKIFSN